MIWSTTPEFVGRKVGQVGPVLMTNPQYVKANDPRELVSMMRSQPGKFQFDRPASAS
ncbi:MAG: hypothetical protein IPO58_26625 [Betaproteobacteria bacterium]|nr:hypothetical protein [Betaproteobacteria bacterium]